MKRITTHSIAATLAIAVALSAQLATAQPVTVTGGEVNISGATLFKDFFPAPASTNDYIDADGDGQSGSNLSWPPDQLAGTFTAGLPLTTYWQVQYRGMGSVKGLNELLISQACDNPIGSGIPWIPDYIPSDVSYFNRFKFAEGGAITWGGPYGDASGTPVSPSQIDLAVMDVPSVWGTSRVGTAAWHLKPDTPGYGMCPILSSTGAVSNLQSLEIDCDGDSNPDVIFNGNTASPDGWTLFDTPVAWVPIAMISNRGTGIDTLAITELQHLFLTGRLPSGENIAAATRSFDSGTRNGAMNSIAVDPSWGRGENLFGKDKVTSSFQLGPNHRSSNAGGSSLMETAVENRRLAIGYTGLGGGSRAAKDADSGKYEVIDVIFDDRGGSLPVRASINTVLDNLDPDTGFQIGGPESFISLGNPAQTDSGAIDYMTNQHAAAYVNNISESVANFVSVPADPRNDGMPGEFLAVSFFLSEAVDALPDLANNDPASFIAQPSPPFNQNLQDFTRFNNGLGWGGDTPAYGSVNPAGRTPVRTGNPDFGDGELRYTDGSADGSYCYSTSASSSAVLIGGQLLGSRNALAGDFDNDGFRDINDAEEMVEAYFDPRGFEAGVNHAGDPGDQLVNSVIPEVIGDYDGNGDFSKEDLRYWFDGLGIDPNTGLLNRKAAAIALDDAIIAQQGRAMLPWADTRVRIITPAAAQCDDPTINAPADIDTFLATGKPYVSGDIRGDVAGSSPVAGAQPLGWDGKVDDQDIDYCCGMTGVWTNIDDAIVMDLSCDMDGDLDVDADDITELVEDVLGTKGGDADLDGDVDGDDEAIIQTNMGQPGGWADGNFNCDDVVDAQDLAIWQANVGGCAPTALTWGSVMSHGPEGDLAIVLDPAAAGEAVVTEPRNLPTVGVAPGLLIEVTFDSDISACLIGDATANNGASVESQTLANGGTTLQINLTDVVDGTCYAIDLATAVDGITGAVTCPIGVLNGNTNSDHLVSSLDRAQLKLASGDLASNNPRVDLNKDGTVTSLDRAIGKLRSGNSLTCP